MTLDELNTLQAAIDRTVVWALSPEGGSFWSNIHWYLVEAYGEAATHGDINEKGIYYELRDIADSFLPEQEYPRYSPLYTLSDRQRLIKNLIDYTNKLRKIDNELSRFVLGLIANRHRYDFRRGNHALNAVDRL